MHRCARTQITLIGFLMASAAITVAAQETTPLVGQYVLAAFESSNESIGDLCAKTHPALRPDFDKATATLRPRILSALKSLLETEQFRSLSQAQAPKDLVEASANSAQWVRKSSANMSLADCTKAIDDMGSMSDEMLRGGVYQMLFYSKMMIDMRKKKEAK